MELKQYDRAVQCYETLAKAEPNNPEIKAGLEAARKEAAKQPTSAPGSIER
jgi:cytochrome c-type biogenesis protein CcmH/NrfG